MLLILKYKQSSGGPADWESSHTKGYCSAFLLPSLRSLTLGFLSQTAPVQRAQLAQLSTPHWATRL